MVRTLLALLVTLAPATARYEPFDFPSRPCAAGNFFDVSALACLPCPAGQEPDADGTSCVCAEGRVLVGSSCVTCNATGTAPTRDRSACLPCTGESNSSSTCDDPDATLGLVNSECACPAGRVLVERDGHGGLLAFKRCRPCPTGTYAASAVECRACPRPHMVAASTGGGCVCDTGYRSFSHSGGWWGHELTCVPEAEYSQLSALGYYAASAISMSYVDLHEAQGASSITVDESKALQQLLMPSASACLVAVTASTTAPRAQPLLEGNQACQAVGNLCVLTDYNTGSAACELYRYLRDQVPSASNEEWPQRMPGLYYPERGLVPITPAAPAIDTTLALPPAAGSRVRYVLAPYSLNGTFLGLQELGTQL